MIRGGGNPLLDHEWGISSGADRVWAQVAGMAPSTMPWERQLMVLQAFIDESVSEGGTFVLAGYIATAEAWADFSKEWEELLPTTTKGKSGRYRFKMSEMARYMDRVPPFYEVIRRYAVFALSCKIDIGELRRAIARIDNPNGSIDFGKIADPYFFCFRALMDTFHNNRIINEGAEYVQKILPLDQQIDFYFDDHTAKSAIVPMWEGYMVSREDEFRDLYGAVPRFENDEVFMPLQAADFWAWWARKGYDESRFEDIRRGDFGAWQAKGIDGFAITFDEEQIVDVLMGMARASQEILGTSIPIYDKEFSGTLLQRIRRFFQNL
jgi:hypothetical protein